MLEAVRAAVIVLGLAATADAAPRAALPDWVGDYTGKLAWTACTVPGARTATLALDAIDGAPAIDLAPAGGGLRALTLAEDLDAGTLAAQDGDVTVAIARPRANTIALSVDLASGCRVRGTLVRASSKVAACDRLVALARIQQACTKLPEPRAPLAAEKWKAKDAPRCTARADEVQTALVDAGCLAAPDPLAGQLGPQCRQLVTEIDRIVQCASLPPGDRLVLRRLATFARPAPDAAQRSVAEGRCRDAHELVAESAAVYRCPL